MTQQNAASSEELATSAEELSSQAEQLKQSIAYFKVDDQTMSSFKNQTNQYSFTARNNGGNGEKKASTKPATKNNGHAGVDKADNAKGADLKMYHTNKDDVDYENY